MEVSPIDERFAMSQHLGKYRLVATLGQGGMGTVYLALATGVGQFRKLLVVKELLPDLTRKEGFIEMFLDEARLAARLDHPNVVQTFEAGNDAGRYFLAMEYLDGQPLSALLERLKDRGGLPLHIHLQILTEVLAGLHYAHELTEYDGTKFQIVHRDVSPQNIFVTYDGQVKVVDFGIAKATVGDGSTTPGVFKGKFGYAAPEQVRGEAVDARTDVFAMGVIMWEALTMKRFADVPVSRTSVAARLSGAEPRISSTLPRLDPRLIEICDRALQVDPAARYATAEEFRQAIEGYLTACGQRIEATSVRQVMGAKFANERKAIHRLIDAHIKHGPPSSGLPLAPLLASEPGNEDMTAVADLSRYVQNTHETVVSGIQTSYFDAPLPEVEIQPDPEQPPQPQQPQPSLKRWAWASAGVVAVGMSFAYGRVSSESAPPPRASVTPPAVSAPLNPPVAQPSAAEASASATAPRANAPTALPKTSAVSPQRPAAEAMRRARPPSRRPRVTEPTIADVAPAIAPEPAPVVGSQEVDIGTDLNQLDGRKRARSIDTEL